MQTDYVNPLSFFSAFTPKKSAPYDSLVLYELGLMGIALFVVEPIAWMATAAILCTFTPLFVAISAAYLTAIVACLVGVYLLCQPDASVVEAQNKTSSLDYIL